MLEETRVDRQTFEDAMDRSTQVMLAAFEALKSIHNSETMVQQIAQAPAPVPKHVLAEGKKIEIL